VRCSRSPKLRYSLENAPGALGESCTTTLAPLKGLVRSDKPPPFALGRAAKIRRLGSDVSERTRSSRFNYSGERLSFANRFADPSISRSSRRRKSFAGGVGRSQVEDNERAGAGGRYSLPLFGLREMD